MEILQSGSRVSVTTDASLQPFSPLPYLPVVVRETAPRPSVHWLYPVVRFCAAYPYAIALAYVALHLRFLAPALEDIDSINFALGLRDFDVARYQPHPPGYPVYIALGKISLALIRAMAPSLEPVRAEALALAIWSALGGAIALVAAAKIFAALHARAESTRGGPVAAYATLLLGVSPLFWMSGLRPMSDMPGLAAALVAQALLLQAPAHRTRLVQGALVAGLAAGVRSQCVWLTVPLFVFALLERRREGLRWLLSRPVAAFGAGALAWVVPLLVASGGIDDYRRVVGMQAMDDLASVDMLWSNPTPRRLAFGLYDTFALPWASTPLAVMVLAAAAAGGIVMLARARNSLGRLAVAFGPYAVWHLLFQQAETVRYALPVLPAVALLAVHGLSISRRLAPWLVALMASAALVVAVPGAIGYASEPHPAFRAIADATLRARTDFPAGVHSHHSVWRTLQADTGNLPVVEPRPGFAWMGLVNYWRQGGTAPVWFFANPHRTDVAFIDPRSRRDVTRYVWSIGARPELGGARPVGVDWYRLSPPSWFVGEGWALTPETAGLAAATGKGPDLGPIEAYVRRRPGPMHLVIGGWHLGSPSGPPAHFTFALGGSVVDEWTVTAAQRTFLRFIDLPGGLPPGTTDYTTLTFASPDNGRPGPPVPVALRQFDIRPATRLIWGFGEGWHESEMDRATGIRWRWTSEKSVLRVKGPPQPLRVTLRGEVPPRRFDARPPTVRVTAGGRSIAEFRPHAEFEWSVTIPADDVARAAGAITIETDQVYVPRIAEGTADNRHLGLRVHECRVESLAERDNVRADRD